MAYYLLLALKFLAFVFDGLLFFNNIKSGAENDTLVRTEIDENLIGFCLDNKTLQGVLQNNSFQNFPVEGMKFFFKW